MELCGVVWCDVLAREYRGLKLLVLCSSINKCCCCSVCMYEDSQQFISFPSLHGCSSCKVCSGLPYSCWLLRICIAYADRGLLVLCILCVRDAVLLKTCQLDRHRFSCMFCIVTYKFH